MKCLLIVLLSFQMTIGYENEKMKTYDSSARSYPLRVSHYHRQQSPGKLMKVKSVSSVAGSQKFKRDNVKGEMIPQSRRDIMNIKKLTFHGRDPPSVELVANMRNKTVYEPHYKKVSYSEQQSAENDPPIASQRKDVYPSTKNKKKVQKVQNPANHANHVGEIPPYVPDDSPFYPLMKPSPINVMPTTPPSFDTVRSYVQYLKMRQNKFFSDFNDDDQPLPEVNSKHVLATSPYEGEIDYFKTREHELAREEQLRNQFSPTNYVKRIESSDETEQPPNTDDESSASHESELNKVKQQQSSDEENAVIIQRADNDDEVIGSSELDSNNYSVDYAEESDNGEDESKKRENFVPFRLYAQVRHVESDHHEKPPKAKSNVKEKVSLAKKNIYYKEEGYEDKNYDHGAEKIDYDFNEKRNKRPGKKRSKRSADEDIDVSELPVALAYIKKSELPQLTGEKLFNHLDELIRNSSKYIPDEDDGPIRFKAIQPSSKYPHHSFPDKILSQMSSHRYSENLKYYPKRQESLYASKNVKPCEEIEENVEPVPRDIEEKGKRTKFNDSPKRLNNLGDKIQCFREKYFGKDPFDNPLFKEDEYVEATIPIPVIVNHNLSRQVNPLITVYDDVIHNIRSGMENDFKQKREAEDVLKQASEQIAIKAKHVTIPNFSAVAGVSQLPMFDINTFLPKFRGSISKFSDEEDVKSNEIQTSTVSSTQSRKRKRNNLILENQNLDPPTQQVKNTVVEVPKLRRHKNKTKKKQAQLNTIPETPPKPISSTIKNIQPSKAVKSSSKYRRFVIPPKHITTITQQLPPPSNGKTTYRFKLL